MRKDFEQGRNQELLESRAEISELAKTKRYSGVEAYLQLAETNPDILQNIDKDGGVPEAIKLNDLLKSKGASGLVSFEEISLITLDARTRGMRSVGDSFIAAYLVGNTPEKFKHLASMNPLRDIKQSLNTLEPDQEFVSETFTRALNYTNQIGYRLSLMWALSHGLSSHIFEYGNRKPLTLEQANQAKKELEFDEDVLSLLEKNISYSCLSPSKEKIDPYCDAGIAETLKDRNQLYLKESYFNFDSFLGFINREFEDRTKGNIFRGIVKDKGIKFWQSSFFKDYYSGLLHSLEGELERNV